SRRAISKNYAHLPTPFAKVAGRSRCTTNSWRRASHSRSSTDLRPSASSEDAELGFPIRDMPKPVGSEQIAFDRHEASNSRRRDNERSSLAMCGIVGVLSLSGHGRVDGNLIARMRDTMVHRGPDGYDTWICEDRKVGFGHRRLSIIDIADAASQPMQNEDGQVIITFNGEIYNHASLRPQLVAAGHRFRTDHSDTEVLVHGYEEWGLQGLLDRIEGDYAFGIWDQRKQSMSLALD